MSWKNEIGSEFSLTVGCSKSNDFSCAAVRIEAETEAAELHGAAGPEIEGSTDRVVGLKRLKKPLEI